MGSNYFGSDANGRSCVAGMSSSSRSKGKKNGSDKPKQPQRGLGVAQLEKIRLHYQMECNYLPTFHYPFAQNFIQEDMGLQTSVVFAFAFLWCSGILPSNDGIARF
ncbi:protein SPEAR3-like [Primulina eburnea]|uniref:protein SPEAR3-like n=1 Tax=Primulina eburnea TaxID=1245227 RepID=UPI003C6CC0F7